MGHLQQFALKEQGPMGSPPLPGLSNAIGVPLKFLRILIVVSIIGALLTGMVVYLLLNALTAEQKPSIGCNIKWKPGNAPE